MEQWWFREGQKEKGPVSRRGLISVIRYGSLGPDDLIRSVEMDWHRLSVSEFSKELTAAPQKSLGMGRAVLSLNGTRQGLGTLLKRPRAWMLAALRARGLRKDVERWVKYYGPFDVRDYGADTVTGLANETGCLFGEFRAWAREYGPASPVMLLAGESGKTAEVIGPMFHAAKCLSTGLGPCEYPWDFNEPAPKELPTADLIISQSILEHILSPMLHVTELAQRLNRGGLLMVFTCLPGFEYHRYPHDTLRYHPDWFEAMADRLRLEVLRRRIVNNGLFYCLRKP